jgi:hypothetical protein
MFIFFGILIYMFISLVIAYMICDTTKRMDALWAVFLFWPVGAVVATLQRLFRKKTRYGN